MDRKTKIALISGISVVILVLVVFNFRNYHQAKEYEELLEQVSKSSDSSGSMYLISDDEGEPSDENDETASLLEQIETLKKQLDEAAGGSKESDIHTAATDFFNIYYTRDSNISVQESLAKYDGLITDRLLKNYEEKLRQAPTEDGVNVYKIPVAVKTYVNTKSDRKATVLSFVRVTNIYNYTNGLAEDNSNSSNMLIQIELSNENGTWLVNDLVFEENMYAVPNLTLDDIFS